ncbi:MAG TPA: helix-hairpin-helix domain-containing protein [Lysobacter sp.]|nr:helix-hairpin-helix domain-containing protein [Lysobacter sp.]
MTKARHAADAHRLEDIPNIGPSLADDLRALGIQQPAQLHGKDPVELYLRLCTLTEARQDPCVLDTFIAAVGFIEHDDARPWWARTTQRKRDWPGVEARLPVRLRRS